METVQRQKAERVIARAIDAHPIGGGTRPTLERRIAEALAAAGLLKEDT
jgi:hypothetical protein